MTTQDTTGDSDARAAALELLKSGEAKEAEIAELAGVGRSLVHYWAKAAGINSAKVRKTRLITRWRKALARRR